MIWLRICSSSYECTIAMFNIWLLYTSMVNLNAYNRHYATFLSLWQGANAFLFVTGIPHDDDTVYNSCQRYGMQFVCWFFAPLCDLSLFMTRCQCFFVCHRYSTWWWHCVYQLPEIRYAICLLVFCLFIFVSTTCLAKVGMLARNKAIRVEPF